MKQIVGVALVAMLGGCTLSIGRREVVDMGPPVVRTYSTPPQQTGAPAPTGNGATTNNPNPSPATVYPPISPEQAPQPRALPPGQEMRPSGDRGLPPEPIPAVPMGRRRLPATQNNSEVAEAKDRPKLEPATPSVVPVSPVAMPEPGELPIITSLSAKQEAEAEEADGPPVSLVNSKRIQFNYQIKDVGPSGVSKVEVWCTHNGKPWKKIATTAPGEPVVVDVPEEGRYGFTMVARNGAGEGKAPPKGTDRAQALVEVDLTKPVVQLLGVQPDAETKTLTIQWKASDKNLGPQPIALLWAKEAAGPWLPIVTSQENTGRHVWKLPAGLPASFLLRVEATDMAGNVAIAQTEKPIVADLSQPSVSILNVEAVEPRQRPLMVTIELVGD